MNLFDFRWNVLAGRQIGLYDDSFGHFELHLRDILADVLAATPFKEEKKLAGHRNVVDTVATVIHGSHFSRLAIKNEGKEGIGNGAVGGVAASSAASSSSSAAGDIGGAAVQPPPPPIRWHMKATAADNTALLQGATDDPSDLVRIARSRGLLWDESHAINFVLQVTQRESMLLELAQHKFPDLYSDLRVAARPSSSQASEVRASAAMMPPIKQGASLMELVSPLALARAGGSSSEFRMAAAPRPSVEVAAEAAAAALGLDGVGVVKKKRVRLGEKGAGQRVEEPKGRDSRERANKRNAAKKAKRNVDKRIGAD